jgi:hypothetical protein
LITPWPAEVQCEASEANSPEEDTAPTPMLGGESRRLFQFEFHDDGHVDTNRPSALKSGLKFPPAYRRKSRAVEEWRTAQDGCTFHIACAVHDYFKNYFSLRPCLASHGRIFRFDPEAYNRRANISREYEDIIGKPFLQKAPFDSVELAAGSAAWDSSPNAIRTSADDASWNSFIDSFENSLFKAIVALEIELRDLLRDQLGLDHLRQVFRRIELCVFWSGG